MKIVKLLTLICAFSANVVLGQENEQNKDTQIPEGPNLELPRIKVIPIKDSNTGGQYELYIKLPEKYSENEDLRYPVLYYTDALWHVELLSASVEFLMENAVLVGISWEKGVTGDLGALGAHASRYRDYSIMPSSDAEKQAKYHFGQGSTHLDFIRNNVFRYVENNYRVDPDQRTYFGYSLGGLFGTYILLKKPDTFKNYIIGSPSLWRANPMLSELGSNIKSFDANVFITNGSLENELSVHIDEFLTMLRNKNDESLSLQHVVIEGSHQTAFPMTGVKGVTWLSALTKKE